MLLSSRRPRVNPSEGMGTGFKNRMKEKRETDKEWMKESMDLT